MKSILPIHNLMEPVTDLIKYAGGAIGRMQMPNVARHVWARVANVGALMGQSPIAVSKGNR